MNEAAQLIVPEVNPGDLVTVFNWRISEEFQVKALTKPYWDAEKECWAISYPGFPDSPGYATWTKDHWLDGEY